VPALANGDRSLARRLAAANVAALAGDEPVVVDCGSCGLALTFYYEDVLRVPGAASLKNRVKDFSQLASPEAAAPGTDRLTAYHDPCHLARGLGVKAEPRALLARRGRVVEIESPGGVTCCGGAGAYGLGHADVAALIGDERARAIEATGAAVVATGCAACVFYLNDALARRGSGVRARHTAEIAAA
jgi:glycolate oxidase iron-sulfur subunit